MARRSASERITRDSESAVRMAAGQLHTFDWPQAAHRLFFKLAFRTCSFSDGELHWEHAPNAMDQHRVSFSSGL